MSSKLLQTLGVLAILGSLAIILGGFFVLKDRVRLIVQSDAADAGPEPVELLRDDVQVLQGRIDALQEALATNFAQLAEGLEGAAAARHEEILARLAAQLAPADPRAVASASEPSQTEQVPIASGAQVPANSTESAASANGVSKDKPAGARSKGFLSFQLPDTKLALNEVTAFELLPRLCRVGFDGKSTLHDFTGVTSSVRGRFALAFDKADTIAGIIEAEAATLDTGVEGRDANMHEHLDVKQHGNIRFEMTSFRPAADGFDAVEKSARGTIDGRMTIRGKTNELSMPIEVQVDPQRRLVVKGQTILKLSDYGVPVPNQLGVVKMEDEVLVWIALRARAKAATK
ncbi:MAG: YceI family protein [Planctomycetota bacterium]